MNSGVLKNTEQNAQNTRANAILEVIMSYARLDFAPKTYIEDGSEDVMDAIAAGVNMLGEELKASTVSLLEKEQLLKEIHHRVKNNLQIINSLINLQCELISDQRHKEALIACRNRIKSMALVHEMLYSTPDLSKIALKGYVSNLVQQLSFSYTGDRKEIEVDIQVDASIYFEMDTMIPLGLVLNEMITNALRHAYPEGKGVIYINATNVNELITISVRDNGVGIKESFDFKNTSGLGLQLIQILCDQVDANLFIENKSGLKVEMKMTLAKPLN
ncbi:MAG TPA: sensor histidine kinase [Flavobacteriales bacterium]|nr:sensor histidine kinase [Flavobacteriales bacterium]